MDERIKAHMALVKKWHDDVLSPWEDQSWQAVEASARQLAEQPGGMKLVPASPTLEVRKHLEGKVGVDFLIAYADWCRPLTASPTEQAAKPKFINEEEAINHYLLTRTPSAPQQAEPCFCDRTGLGEPGVSCGDCPTRDYKQFPSASKAKP